MAELLGTFVASELMDGSFVVEFWAYEEQTPIVRGLKSEVEAVQIQDDLNARIMKAVGNGEAINPN